MSTLRSCVSCSDCLDSNLDEAYTKYYFTGEVDQDGLRNKYGYQTWNGYHQHQYAGNFLCNNMHDKGFYFIRQENNFSFFDGQFYNNKLEGYGQVIHDDGRIYEGLFKDNKRFGPGILTHTDGTQDIGFWNGNSLLRLSISASSDFIPTLCSTSFSKTKILRFKKIVSALPQREDLAKNMMLNLGADDKIFDSYPELYNYYVRNENSSFFDRRYYDLAQLGSEVATIDVVEDYSLGSQHFDDTITEYDDICMCTNERCLQLNRQIDEINFELEKIHNDIIRLKKKLRTCAECCMIEEHDTEPVSVEENLKKVNSGVENVKYPSEIFSTTQEFSTNYKVEKNWNQMILQTSVVDMNEIIGNLQNEVPVLESAHTEPIIEKISVNESQCDPSIECDGLKGYDKISLPKKTCECMDRNIPDIDFLLSELEVLEKSEKFHEIVLQYLNNVLCKEITSTMRVVIPKTLQVHVEHLLAWNNDKYIIDIMQHCFRYRNFENMLSFNIKSLLSGDRTVFGEMGKQERYCMNFLKHCGLNQLNEVREDLMKYNIHPDLSDARGNGGIHFAVTNDCREVIEQLSNLGANLDAFNDECLTPLLLAILRYIAAINVITSWESAFLPEIVLNSEELEEVVHWRPHESLVNLREFMGSSSHLIRSERHASMVDRKRSADGLSLRTRLTTQSRKSTSAKMALTYLFSTLFLNDSVRYKKTSAQKRVSETEKKQIGSIESTISTLLHLGADPNVGEVPICPVLLIIFTKNVNLVEVLLKNGANPNSHNEEGLSALHILACQPFSSNNVQIAEKFLNYSCDPNIKTGSDFWLEQDDELLGDVSDMSDNEVNLQGKTPIQMICMRKDFDVDNSEYQCALVRMLIDHGAINDHYYLGHTLLSVAVLRKNVHLIETLYPYVNGSRPLGENMGNALTLFGLNRFSYMKSFTTCKETIDKLVSLGMDPFDPVYSFPNVFEFFSNEYSEDTHENNRKIRAKLEAEYKKLAKNFESHEVNRDINRMAVAYIREIGKKILSKVYQYKAIKHLMLLAEGNNLDNIHGKYKAKLLNVEDAIKCIKLLIHHENMQLNFSLKNLLLKLLEFIRDCNPKLKARKKKKMAKVLNLLDEISKLKEYDTEIPPHGARYMLDLNQKKYDVCYHCLKRSTKSLVTCPLCGIAKFCSDICNKFNKKTKSKHPCNILFYDSVKSNKFKFPESNISGKEHASFRQQRRATLDSQRSQRKSDKSLAKKSCFSTDEILEEDNAMKLDSCCIKENSFLVFCDENKYLRSIEVDCGFLCRRVVSDFQMNEMGEIEGEQEFCVCYSRNQELSEVAKLEEFIYNENLKENVIEDNQKNVNEMTEDDIINVNFDKLLKRFRKKPPEDIHLGNGQIKLHKTQNSKKLKYQTNQNITYNEKQTGIHKSMLKESEKYTDNSSASNNQSVMKNQIKSRIEKRGNYRKSSSESIVFNETKLSEPFEDDKTLRQKQKRIEKGGKSSKANKRGLKKERKGNKIEEKIETTQNNNVNEKLFAERKVKNVGEDNMTPELLVSRNLEKQLKDDHESSASSAHEDGKRKKKDKNHNKELNKQQVDGAKIKTKTESEGKGSLNTRSQQISGEEMIKSVHNKAIEKKNFKAYSTDLDRKKFSSNQNNARINKMRRKIADNKKNLFGEKNETMTTSDFDKSTVSNRGSSEKIKTSTPKTKKRLDNKIQNSSNKIIGEKENKTIRIPEGRELEVLEKKKQLDNSKFLKEEFGGIQRHRKTDQEEKWTARDKMKTNREKEYLKMKTEKNKARDAWIKKYGSEGEKAEKEINVAKKLESQLSDQVATVHNFKGQKGLDTDAGQSSSSYSNNCAKFKKFPKQHQYFLELLSQYFPEFNLNDLLLPFACFVDGQLYYKFTDSSPYYCRTYSSV